MGHKISVLGQTGLPDLSFQIIKIDKYLSIILDSLGLLFFFRSLKSAITLSPIYCFDWLDCHINFGHKCVCEMHINKRRTPKLHSMYCTESYRYRGAKITQCWISLKLQKLLLLVQIELLKRVATRWLLPVCSNTIWAQVRFIFFLTSYTLGSHQVGSHSFFFFLGGWC